MSAHLRFPFCPDSPRNCRRSPAFPARVLPWQKTSAAVGHTHPSQNCKGQAGEGSWVGTRAATLWKSHAASECAGSVGGYRENQDGVWGMETWITDDPRAGGSLGVLFRTCAGRHVGTPVISWTPYTPSVSQLCSTFTWPQSQTPSLLGVFWEMPLKVPRYMGLSDGTGVSSGVPLA